MYQNILGWYGKAQYLRVIQMRTSLLLGVVEEKVFSVEMRERSDSGIWKSPEQREKVVDGTQPAD